MGELDSIWLYQEDDDDLKQKLQSTRMELEAVRLEVKTVKEQTIEKERQLLNLFQMACKERDEAREQLQILLTKINKTSDMVLQQQPCLMFTNSDQQLQYPRANSSITESNTLSDPFNNLNNTNSYVSSPVDSIFDAVTSPEFSTLNNHQTFVHDMGQQTNPKMMSMLDHATMVIDELVKGKVLPQKGKLLDAVMESGPLLQTLMLAGPLPRWRNPPTVQPFRIPVANAHPLRPNCTPFAEMSCGSSSHMGTNSMLNFGNGGGSNLRLVSPAMRMINMSMNDQIPVGKRQRLM